MPLTLQTARQQLTHRQPVIFCDFDGTITERDVIISIMERFAPPQWQDIVDGILHRKTIRIDEGVRQLFALLPSTLKPEIIQFVNEAVQLRAGFENFLPWLKTQHIPFLVVSGGLDFFIEPVLKPFSDQLQIFCNHGRFDGNTIAVDFPHAPATCEACGHCGCCKIKIMNAYPADRYFRIAIGDSITDVGISTQADLVFARSHLAVEMGQRELPCLFFESFDDIRIGLETLLQPLPQEVV